MAVHVIVGAGPVGSGLAAHLAAQGHEVRVVTRSGGGPEQVDRIRADASDPAALIPHVRGAAALYNCANPPSYRQWEEQWPPLAGSLLRAAEQTGAVLVTMSNLYGYGPVAGPIRHDSPLAATSRKGRLRAWMWHDALAAHEAGRAQVTEVRASDYVGPTTTAATGLLAMYARAVLRGRPAWVLGDPDAPHSWTYVSDVVRTLAAVAADPRAWGRTWLVPTNPPVPVRAVLADVARLAGARPARVRAVPRAVSRALGLVVPVLREVDELMYQFDRPFVVDAGATTATFGLRPTPWEEALAATVAGWSGRAAAPTR